MHSARHLLGRLALVALTVIAPLAAWADGDPPGRIGRVSEMQGGVSMFDIERGQWEPALRNRPLTQGDRLSTDGGGRAELRVGSTTVRLGANTELEVLRLDDDRVSLQLHSGTLALRVRSRDVADETEVVTAEARLLPQRGGHFRIDRIDDSTYASSWRGELRVAAGEGGDEAFVIDNGRRAEIWREGGRRSLRHSWSQAPDDAFAAWAQREDQRDERSASNRYVSPEMTGAEDLDRNGRWEQNSEYGAVWVPLVARADWAPYRYGRWAWVQPWGWTWVDDAAWGFAPFHYGRWVSLGGRWGWAPGSYVARPVYAPALVAWVGGPRLNVSIQIGGPLLPGVGWVPLAPRDVFVPYYRASPVYGDRINHRPPGHHRPPEQVPTGPVMYGNQGVPGAVTVVPRDVLLRREPVARAVVDLRSAPGQHGGALATMSVVPAPAGPPVANAPNAPNGPNLPNVQAMRPAPPPALRGTWPVPPEANMPLRPPTRAPGAAEAAVQRALHEPQREHLRRDAPQDGSRRPAPSGVVDLRQPRERAPAPPAAAAPVARPAQAAAPPQPAQPAPPPPAARPLPPPERGREQQRGEEPRARAPESRNNNRERDQLR